MFNNNTNHNDEETSFTEAYKSQILNDPEEEESESIVPKLLITLLIIVVISGLSIYGYKTFGESKKVTEPSLPEESLMIDNIDDLTEDSVDDNQPPPSKSLDSVSPDSKTDEQNMEEDIKLEISKDIEEKKITTPEKLTTSTQKGEDKYLEQLAELSKEIDGEEE